MKINIAIAGGPATGKSTLAAMLFAKLKVGGFEYDLIFEECRKLKKELGQFRSPFERFYIWRQQEREELRSTAADGFITDSPLFHYYVQARLYAAEPRDLLAVRELFRMCLEIDNRYQLIVIAKNPTEIPYKTDASRTGTKENSMRKHALVVSFVEHFWGNRILFVDGGLDDRVSQVINKLEAMRGEIGGDAK